MKGGIGHEEAQMEKEDPVSNRLGMGCISTPPGRQVMVQGSEGAPHSPTIMVWGTIERPAHSEMATSLRSLPHAPLRLAALWSWLLHAASSRYLIKHSWGKK